MHVHIEIICLISGFSKSSWGVVSPAMPCPAQWSMYLKYLSPLNLSLGWGLGLKPCHTKYTGQCFSNIWALKFYLWSGISNNALSRFC